MTIFNEYWATSNRILFENKLRRLNCARAWSTMLKERGKWLQLRFNIPNIPENKRNVERMLKQSLKAFKLFQHRFNILSTRFNNVERGWQTLSTLRFNKIERMLKQMLKPFARFFISEKGVYVGLRQPRGAGERCVNLARADAMDTTKPGRELVTTFGQSGVVCGYPFEIQQACHFLFSRETSAAFKTTWIIIERTLFLFMI